MSGLLSAPFSCIAPVGAALGEGPLFDGRDGCVYWVDIKGNCLFRHDLESGETSRFRAEGMVSAIAPARSHQFVCAYRNGFAFLDLEDEEARLTPIIDPERGQPENRFNDGKADPFGNFWAGTMHDPEEERSGAFWRLAPDGSAKKTDDGYFVANGPAFDASREKVYLVDSADRRIVTATLTEEGMTEPSAFCAFGKEDGYPDGLTVDREGCLWVAFWDGGCVRRLSPDGAIVDGFSLPVSRPTSVAIQGNMVFVTSASTGLDKTRLVHEPLAGGLFMARLSRPLGAPESAIFAG